MRVHAIIENHILINVKYTLHLSFNKIIPMNYLLPHRCKKMGAIMAPIGLLLWLCMQMGIVTRVLVFVFGNAEGQNSYSYHIVNVTIAILSFFSFLSGIYFVTFSKEKIEDEMVQRIRLDSFHFAALIQIIVIILGFLAMLIFRDPGESGLLLFFIGILFLFWLSFIGRFNYILHFKFKQMKNTIKEARTHLQLTQVQLAEMVNVSRQTIISIENSRYIPSVLLSLKLAIALRKKVEALFQLDKSD